MPGCLCARQTCYNNTVYYGNTSCRAASHRFTQNEKKQCFLWASAAASELYSFFFFLSKSRLHLPTSLPWLLACVLFLCVLASPCVSSLCNHSSRRRAQRERWNQCSGLWREKREKGRKGGRRLINIAAAGWGNTHFMQCLHKQGGLWQWMEGVKGYGGKDQK